MMDLLLSAVLRSTVPAMESALIAMDEVFQSPQVAVLQILT